MPAQQTQGELSPEFRLTVSGDGRLKKVDMAFSRIMGWRAEQLFGLPMSHLLPGDAQPRLDLLWENNRKLKGILLPRVPLRVANNKGFIHFDLLVAQEEENGLRIFEAYKPQQNAGTADDEEPLETEAFFDFVDAMINGPGDGADTMTMVDFEGLRGSVAKSHGDATEDALRKEIESSLKSHAKGGKLGRLDEASYAFLCDDGFNQEALEKALADTAKRLKVNEEQLGMKSHGLGIDSRDLDSKQLKMALNHARGVFLGEIEGENEATLTDVIDGVTHHRNLILKALEKSHFRTTKREIRDGRQNIRVGMLDQPKVIIDTRIRLADELIVLRDHVDVAVEHDVTIASEVIRLRGFLKGAERDLRAWFEICVSSLSQEDFYKGLADALKKHDCPASDLGIRVRGLPATRAGGPLWQGIDRLQQAGHPIWIDRFADAVIDPTLLDRLKGGMVEVSRSYLDRIKKHPEGKALTIKLVETWTKKGITLLSADLQNQERKVQAHEVGLYIALADE